MNTRCPAVGVPAVTPCDPAELAPLVAWLGLRQPCASPQVFPRGTALPDGRLDLCKQSLGPDGARAVLAALPGHPSIRSILFGTGAIGNPGAAAVADALSAGATLDTVYLGCNRIDEAGLAALSPSLRNSPVRALWLKRNPLGLAGAHRVADLIASGAPLHVLDLFNCELDDDGVAAIAAALASPQAQVEHIYLGGNAAGPLAAAALSSALSSTSRLRGLHLSASHLGDDGAVSLAAGLAANRSLAELTLADNAIGSAGGTALCHALAAHPHLTLLDLGTIPSSRVLGASPNQLGNAAAPALASLLTSTRTLRTLDLRANGITSRGAFPIAVALDACPTLTTLHLHHGVAQTLRRRIRARLAANAALHPPCSGPPPHVAAIQSVYRATRRC